MLHIIHFSVNNWTTEFSLFFLQDNKHVENKQHCVNVQYYVQRGS